MKKLFLSLILALMFVGGLNTTIAIQPPFPECLPCPPTPSAAGPVLPN